MEKDWSPTRLCYTDEVHTIFLGHFILVENDPSLTTIFFILNCLSYVAHLLSGRMFIVLS